jgi:LysM repeat protein
MLVVLLVVSGGTAIASTDTQPDNPLHQIKLATENLELLLRPAGEGRTTLLVEILDRRTSELLTMSWQDKAEGAQRALVNYQAALQVGHKMLDQTAHSASDVAFAVQWQEALARNLAVIQGLVDAMPARMQPGLRAVVTATQKEQAWVNDVLIKTPQAPDIATPVKGPEGSPTPGRCLYTVVKGDTLSSIAQKHNTTWQRLAALNSLASPDSIRPGQQLSVPCGVTTPDGQTTLPAEFKLCPYTVKSGDTLSVIAQKYNTTTRLLIAVNNLPSADRILAGQRLSVPCYSR